MPHESTTLKRFYPSWSNTNKPLVSNHSTNEPYHWSTSGDDGVLLGKEYAIKITSFDSTIITCDTLIRRMNLPSVEPIIVTPYNKLCWSEVQKALNDVNWLNNQGKKIEAVTEALVMKRMEGAELHKVILNAPLPKAKLHQIFHDIGKMVVLDLHVRNYDRFPLSTFRDVLLHSEYDDVGDERWIPWDENPENILIDITSGRAIPIDSASYFKGIDTTAYRLIASKLLSEHLPTITESILTSCHYARLFCSTPTDNREIILIQAKESDVYAQLLAGIKEGISDLDI